MLLTNIIFLLFVLNIGTVTLKSLADVPEWTMIPQTDGTMGLENVKQFLEKYIASKNLETIAEFILFTKADPKEGAKVSAEDVETLKQLFNPKNPTRFLIHGWQGSRNSSVNNKIRQNYLSRGDYNIFVVDWSSGADTWNYIEASKNTREAGKQIALFIDFLNENLNLNFDTTYIIGHSLGAHVAGATGKYVHRGRINTIFGLDPALPLFFIDKPERRLDRNDALYVETIHTDAGIRGFDKPIGDASFYPNWGGDQPGCDDSSCSHNRAVHFFAESLNAIDEFDAEQCGSYEDIERRACNPTGMVAKMGGDPSNYGRKVIGEYYLPTNAKSPYAVGTRWMTMKRENVKYYENDFTMFLM